MDKDLVITYANKAFEHHSGRKRRAVIGKGIWRSFPHVAYPESPYKINYEKVLKNKESVTFNYHNVHDAWIQIKAFPTREGGIAVFIRDVTEGVKAQQEIEDSERRFRVLTSMTTDIIFRASPDWSTLVRIDDKKFRNNSDTAQLEWVLSFIPGHRNKLVQDSIRHAIKQKCALSVEFPIHRPGDDFESWMFMRAAPIIDSEGTIAEWFGATIDTTERHRQTEMQERVKLVTEQRNALIKLNKVKDEFVAIASHQLRTPATAVKQYMGMLLDGFAGDVEPKQRKFIQSAYDANERELKLISDLLRTAQIDNMSHHLNAQPTDIVTVVKEVIAEHAIMSKQRNRQVILDYKSTAIILPIDAVEIKLALTNLVENACKYSYEDSAITIDLWTDELFAYVSVTDEGVGISPEDQAQIFDKFTRIRNDLTDLVQGTGLGLYWVKKIAEMHGGDVTVSSVPKKGSTFTIKLSRENTPPIL